MQCDRETSACTRRLRAHIACSGKLFSTARCPQTAGKNYRYIYTIGFRGGDSAREDRSPSSRITGDEAGLNDHVKILLAMMRGTKSG